MWLLELLRDLGYRRQALRAEPTSSRTGESSELLLHGLLLLSWEARELLLELWLLLLLRRCLRTGETGELRLQRLLLLLLLLAREARLLVAHESRRLRLHGVHLAREAALTKLLLLLLLCRIGVEESSSPGLGIHLENLCLVVQR